MVEIIGSIKLEIFEIKKNHRIGGFALIGRNLIEKIILKRLKDQRHLRLPNFQRLM